MLKFLPGVLLLQIVTVSLVLLFGDSFQGWEWLRLAVPLFIIGVLTTFWFNAMESHHHKDAISKLKEKHAVEREKIKVNAERAKTRIVKQTQKEMSKEVTRSSAKANMKVGGAVVGVACVGGFLLLTQFMALGVIALVGAGGTVGGYLLRMRQERKAMLEEGSEQAPLIAKGTGPKLLRK